MPANTLRGLNRGKVPMEILLTVVHFVGAFGAAFLTWRWANANRKEMGWNASAPWALAVIAWIIVGLGVQIIRILFINP